MRELALFPIGTEPIPGVVSAEGALDFGVRMGLRMMMVSMYLVLDLDGAILVCFSIRVVLGGRGREVRVGGGGSEHVKVLIIIGLSLLWL